MKKKKLGNSLFNLAAIGLIAIMMIAFVATVITYIVWAFQISSVIGFFIGWACLCFIVMIIGHYLEES